MTSLESALGTSGHRGLFIVFEGLDGAGTTTQSALLAETLRGHGITVEVTAEPSAGPIGGLARAALDGRMHLDPAALALVFAADRLDHLLNPVNGIVDSLEKGHWVICDRYVLSSLAYQAAQMLDLEWLSAINSRAITPDVTVFIDTPPDVCMHRILSRSSRDELFHDRGYLRRVRSKYRSVLAKNQWLGELVTASGDLPPSKVADEIFTGLLNLLSTRFNPLVDVAQLSDATPKAASG